MVFYLNVHGCLEKVREESVRENRRGPVVLLCGPADVGKSTLAKILLNYAVGCGRTPIHVDLDASQGSIGIPGTIGCNVIERPCDLEADFSDRAPLVLHYGDCVPEANENLMRLLIAELAGVIKKRMEKEPLVKKSGAIINTSSHIQGAGYRLLLEAIVKFEVDLVLALDQERLYNQLLHDLPDSVKVLLTPKSLGVLIKSPESRSQNRSNRIEEYFYGSTLRGTAGRLYPHSFDLSFGWLRIYQVGAPEVPSSCLPLGMQSADHMTQLVEVQPSMTIQSHVLSLMHADEPTEVLRSHVKGFLCVTDVDMNRQMITVISPQPKDHLPKHPIFLLSKVQFSDSH